MMRKSVVSCLLGVGVTSLAGLIAPVQAFTSLSISKTFNNPTPEEYDRFGDSVSLSGTSALIGASYDNTGATNGGSAYLFDTVTGNLLKVFNNPSPEEYDRFGNSVSLSGTSALIGTPDDDTGATNAGSAYLFDTVTGSLRQTFNNPTAEAYDNFGNSVSLSGTSALIGTPDDDTGATNAGSAYLFDTVTGNLLKTFNNPSPEFNDFFGDAVSLSGTFALIGTPNDNTGARNAGSAYLFDTVTGNLLKTFNNPSPESDDNFGNSVSLSGTFALIGADGDNTGAHRAGSAYLFDTVTGNLLKTLNNPTAEAYNRFGYSVSLSGTLALIGTPNDNTGATAAGSAYLFDTVTGNLRQTFNNPTAQAYANFGNSVSLSGTSALIGADGDNTGATAAGSAYLYQQPQQVPEPSSTLSLLGLGLGALAAALLNEDMKVG